MRAGVLALASVVAVTTACAAGTPPAAVPGVERDIRSLAKQMETIHPNLFHAVSSEDFHAAADQLVGRAPQLEPNELLVELMRLTARPGERDGHTGIFPLDSSHGRRLHLYPVRLYDSRKDSSSSARSARSVWSDRDWWRSKASLSIASSKQFALSSRETTSGASVRACRPGWSSPRSSTVSASSRGSSRFGSTFAGPTGECGASRSRRSRSRAIAPPGRAAYPP